MIPNPDKLLDEGDIIRLAGFSDKAEPDLLRQVMALFIVAVGAGAHEIFPGIFAAVNLGNDMIDSHQALFAAAILAAPTVTFQDIFPGQHYPLAGNFNVIIQPHYGRHGNLLPFGAQDEPVHGFDDLRFPQIHQYDSAFYATYGKRLEILIKY